MQPGLSLCPRALGSSSGNALAIVIVRIIVGIRVAIKDRVVRVEIVVIVGMEVRVVLIAKISIVVKVAAHHKSIIVAPCRGQDLKVVTLPDEL